MAYLKTARRLTYGDTVEIGEWFSLARYADVHGQPYYIVRLGHTELHVRADAGDVDVVLAGTTAAPDSIWCTTWPKGLERLNGPPVVKKKSKRRPRRSK